MCIGWRMRHGERYIKCLFWWGGCEIRFKTSPPELGYVSGLEFYLGTWAAYFWRYISFFSGIGIIKIYSLI